MALDLTLLRLFVAQADSSNITDFVGQISGLVALTCAAGVIWVGLMAFVMQRAAERRRRAAEGLEPLPSIFATVWRALRGEPSTRPPGERAFEPDDAASAPVPDLALLTGEEPLSEAAPEPAPIEPDVPPPPPEPEPTPAPEPEPEPVAPVASQPGPPNSDPGASDAPPETDEVLRVWRDRDTGTLIAEIDGQRFVAGDAPRGSDLERRFIDVVRDLHARTAQPDAAPLSSERPAGRATSTLRQIGRVALGHPSAEPVEAGGRSIADQIEDLLQDRLARLPEFSGRSIHVRPSLHGGVNIVVDDHGYEGIGEIDDPEVRALLEDVVRQWEAAQ